MMSIDDDRQRQLRLLARACDRAGLSTAYGHCSLRIDAHTFLVCASRPMGLIAPGEPGTVVSLDAPLPEGVMGEVRMHREVYRRQPQARAIVRFISPAVVALAALGRSPTPRHGFGAYFAPAVPMWRDPALIRNDAAAEGVATTMGAAPAVVVSVNGAVVAGETLAQTLALAVFLEDAARVELHAVAAGASAGPGLTDEEARGRAVWGGQVAERLWDYWTHGDPESTRAG